MSQIWVVLEIAISGGHCWLHRTHFPLLAANQLALCVVLQPYANSALKAWVWGLGCTMTLCGCRFLLDSCAVLLPDRVNSALTATLFRFSRCQLTSAILACFSLCGLLCCCSGFTVFLGGFSAKQIAREAEAAMFHRQMFEELRRITHLTRDPTESVAIGTVEASFKCCASAIIVLTKTGRWDYFFLSERYWQQRFSSPPLPWPLWAEQAERAHTALSLPPPCPPWHMPSARRPRASFNDAHNLGSYFWPFETWTLTFWKLIISPWSFPHIWEVTPATLDTEQLSISWANFNQNFTI